MPIVFSVWVVRRSLLYIVLFFNRKTDTKRFLDVLPKIITWSSIILRLGVPDYAVESGKTNNVSTRETRQRMFVMSTKRNTTFLRFDSQREANQYVIIYGRVRITRVHARLIYVLFRFVSKISIVGNIVQSCSHRLCITCVCHTLLNCGRPTHVHKHNWFYV